ncbi:MAG TPA: DUF1326 domain-containing protein [Casimicrobiaceae bacterium]
MVEWEIKGKEYANCNCSYACPCQFNARPTHGFCAAAGSFQIDAGHFGEVKLDGLRAGGVYQWPGAVHEGNGTMQLIVDKRADREQREALIKIMSGQETQEMATMWWVFSAMCPNKLEPIFETIELDVDVDARRAKFVVPGVLESFGEPILNPVTGMEHRVRIDLPKGFEYRLAEIGRGRTRTTGKIALDLNDSYGQFARIHLSGRGVVEGTRP